jgi:hypothetical protein
MTDTTPEVAYSLQDKWELEKAYLKIDELQKKNLRLAEKNNNLIKDSIKAQEILTRDRGMRFTEGAMFFISTVTFVMGFLVGVLVMVV